MRQRDKKQGTSVSSEKDLLEEARSFLLHHRWCNGILEIVSQRNWEGLVAVYHASIDPAPGADATVWVIVGDIPPAYIDTPSCPTLASAIQGYVGAMQEWVDRVYAGESTRDCIPVLRRGSLIPIPPTEETALELSERLELIRKHILSGLEEDP